VSLFAKSLDQADADAGLEFANLKTDGWLSEIEATRGGREAAAGHHLGESSQLIQIEAAHLKADLIIVILKTNLP
jgi:hypothetical protein